MRITSAIVTSFSLLAVFLSIGSMGQIDWFSTPKNSGGALRGDGQPEQPSFRPIKIEDAGYPTWDQMPNNPTDMHNILLIYFYIFLLLTEKTTPSAGVLGIESDGLPCWEQMPDNPSRAVSSDGGNNPTETEETGSS